MFGNRKHSNFCPADIPRVISTSSQYYPQTTVPDMVKMAEKEIPGVIMDHKREWRRQKRELDEGTKRGM